MLIGDQVSHNRYDAALFPGAEALEVTEPTGNLAKSHN